MSSAPRGRKTSAPLPAWQTLRAAAALLKASGWYEQKGTASEALQVARMLLLSLAETLETLAVPLPGPEPKPASRPVCAVCGAGLPEYVYRAAMAHFQQPLCETHGKERLAALRAEVEMPTLG